MVVSHWRTHEEDSCVQPEQVCWRSHATTTPSTAASASDPSHGARDWAPVALSMTMESTMNWSPSDTKVDCLNDSGTGPVVRHSSRGCSEEMSKAATVASRVEESGPMEKTYRVVPSTVVIARGPYCEDGKGILHAVSTPEAQAGEIAPVLVEDPE